MLKNKKAQGPPIQKDSWMPFDAVGRETSKGDHLGANSRLPLRSKQEGDKRGKKKGSDIGLDACPVCASMSPGGDWEGFCSRGNSKYFIIVTCRGGGGGRGGVFTKNKKGDLPSTQHVGVQEAGWWRKVGEIVWEKERRKRGGALLKQGHRKKVQRSGTLGSAF